MDEELETSVMPEARPRLVEWRVPAAPSPSLYESTKQGFPSIRKKSRLPPEDGSCPYGVALLGLPE